MILITVFLLLGIITIESRTNRENNAEITLKRATDNAITSILENQTYTVESNEELVATLTEMICDSLISYNNEDDDATTPDENLKLTIEIVEADYIKGLLSLNVVEEYTNPIGAIGTCEYATTVVFDEAKIYDTYTINYFDANGILIESYIVKAGDTFPEPDLSIKDQYHITEWGSVIGGGGAKFTVPDTVPLDSNKNNITTYAQYDAESNSINLYGNYAT